jgi:hypothetical protein
MQPAAPSTRPADRIHHLVPMSSIDDLHDADLDLVLADRLAESALALRAAVASMASRL